MWRTHSDEGALRPGGGGDEGLRIYILVDPFFVFCESETFDLDLKISSLCLRMGWLMTARDWEAGLISHTHTKTTYCLRVRMMIRRGLDSYVDPLFFFAYIAELNLCRDAKKAEFVFTIDKWAELYIFKNSSTSTTKENIRPQHERECKKEKTREKPITQIGN